MTGYQSIKRVFQLGSRYPQQVAFLQGSSSVQQTFNLAAAAYTFTFDAAQRGNQNNGGQEIQVLLDGNIVGAITPQGTNYVSYTTPSFTVATTGSHTIELLGLNPNGGDNTAFIDELDLVLQ